MDIQEILSILPHRYPFLLVDRVVELEPGVRVKAIKNVTVNENFFQGHFPTEPVMPGVLILEALGQAGACAVLSMEEYKGKMIYFGAMDKVKFRRKVVPGDQLELVMEVTKLRASAGIGQATAWVDGKKVAEAQLTFMIG